MTSKLLSILLSLGLTLYTVPSFSKDNNFKDAWKLADLYENEQGNYLKLSGRLQADSAWFDASEGEEYSDLTWRRFRFGFKGKYGHINTQLEGDFNLNGSLSDSYNRLTDAKLSWKVNKYITLSVFKQSAGFTLDGKTSSKKLLTPQRNNLTNNLWFTAEYFSGVSLKGDLVSDWTYKTGIFSSDDSDEIGFTDASYFALFSVGKKLSPNTLWEKGEISVDYIYNDVHEKGNTRDFTHVASFSSKFTQGKWNVWSDIAIGKGDLGQSDIWGVVLMPFYQQTEQLQWVMRYTYLDSDDMNGIRLGRYENEVVSGKGDNYHEFYGGVNYFFNSHKFKVHLGTQYTKMSDEANDGGKYGGWGLTLALRTYW